MKLQNISPVFVLAVAITTSLAVEVKVESSIYKAIEDTGKANIFVSFKKNDIHNIRNQITVQTHVTRGDRINSLQEALKSHADTTQAGVLKAINSYRPLQANPTVKISSFWITNQVYIRHVDRELLEQLSTLDDISEITQEQVYTIDNPLGDSTEVRNSSAEPKWGVAAIRAPEVWASGNTGSGVVVATIDTGVRGTHEALRGGFRKEYGWFDPIEATLEPTDDNGHGTHATGTIVGRTNGIGVAPGAQWIACKGCDYKGQCYQSDIIDCAQFVVCPTDANGSFNCSLAPHIVSNSWSSSNENYVNDGIISMFETAEIAVIFAIGNSGPRCRTVSSPGTHPYVISVGAVDSNTAVADYSSRGPSSINVSPQPDVAAPGSNILSALFSGDTIYGEKSGTSMATPHVAGLVALLKSQNMSLTVSEIRRLIKAGAQPIKGSAEPCGGIENKNYPNNAVGYGMVDAPKTIAGSASLNAQVLLKHHEFVAFSLLIFGSLKFLSF
ncbi:unnamed protein product [Allacma fusca]|uniref:Peptidase S8/S53 domain-containing protein n=1 Tax=Allacma fusca TaxID=39272 RepID=A0A8J2P0P9_9HEXA|nr:unnamed protein product [Allacma fusca]